MNPESILQPTAPQKAYLEEKLDKIIGLGDGGELVSSLIDDIIQANYPLKFNRPNVAHYDGLLTPKCSFLTLDMQK